MRSHELPFNRELNWESAAGMESGTASLERSQKRNGEGNLIAKRRVSRYFNGIVVAVLKNV
jgi:hypothetical protein